MLWFTDLWTYFVHKFYKSLIDIMAFIYSLDHLCFRNNICTGFDHDNFFFCRCNSKLKITLIPLLLWWVYNKLTINESHLCHSTWSIKRNIRNVDSKCCTYHCNDFRTALRINWHNKVVKSNIISVIFREKRSHRTIDNTICKDCILRCLSFSLIEPSRDFAYRIHLFFKFNTEWKKINSIPWFISCCCCR